MAHPNLRLVQGPLAPDVTPAGPSPPTEKLGTLLVDSGALSRSALEQALRQQIETPARLGEILLAERHVAPEDLCAALARQRGTVALDPGAFRPDLGLVDRLGAGFCAVHDVLPLRRLGAATLVVTARPETFEGLRGEIEARLGPVLMAAALPAQLERALMAMRRRRLVMRAETRADPEFSCRSLSARPLLRAAAAAVGLLALTTWLAPLAMFHLVTALAFLVLAVNTGLGIAAAVLFLTQTPGDAASDAPEIARLPARAVPVSILVPLLHEKRIAAQLIERLSRIDYPRALLEMLLVVEDNDTTTRETLREADLPPWMRILIVPAGTIQTKPRALNFALDFCRGAIVGIYDAEDHPEPDQIRKVVAQFQVSPPEVACLQGQLDFYNPHENWIARCFTIDYAVWFRLILPALRRLGFVVPLGGTTLFLRRAALDRLGGWDAHNVTEDADLGVRLARFGYRTDLLNSVTYEEANCRAWPWIRQRSRWLKGYGQTWFVHMRRPAALWRDLGAWRFFGVQVLFLGSIGGALLAPVLWAFLLLTLRLPHPWSGSLDLAAELTLTFAMATCMGVQWMLGWMALRARGRRDLDRSVPLITLYHLMATVAVLKAAAELLVRPFYWDKTSHGATVPEAPTLSPSDRPESPPPP
jgi:cellulose synthase/poly-beta-1,6-N-acetylglucosamine synthase-like glycosyltransferase